MNLKKIALILMCICMHASKAIDSESLQNAISPAAIDKAILEAFEQSRTDQEVLDAKTINNDIAFSHVQDSKTNLTVIMLRTFIDLGELDAPSEKTMKAQTLKDLLVNAFRLKLENETKNEIKTATGAILIVGPSPRLSRLLGEQTQCRIFSDDNYNDCLECKLLMNALQSAQFQSLISAKAIKVESIKK